MNTTILLNSTLLLVLYTSIVLGSALSKADIAHHVSETSKIQDAVSSLKLRCILCDMDGTLLTDDHRPNLHSMESIAKVNRVGYPVIPATGRSRKSMNAATRNIFASILQVDPEEVPGIYSQGLQVYGLDGSLIYERFLGQKAIVAAVQYSTSEDLTIVAYAGNDYYCQTRSNYTDMFPLYNEPIPIVFAEGLDKLDALTGVKINKLMVMAEESEINRIRPALTKALEGLVSITQAVPTMLELLPLGASKGDGVQKFLEHEGIDPSTVMAFGDGENDIEMLKLVGLGVSMGNARAIVKNLADIVTLSNNEGGVGHVLDILLSDVANRQL